MRGKKDITFRGMTVRITVDFLSETMNWLKWVFGKMGLDSLQSKKWSPREGWLGIHGREGTC